MVVGPAAGGFLGPRIGSALAARQLIIFAGQSNARGVRQVSDLSPAQLFLATPMSGVPYMYKLDGNTDPPVFTSGGPVSLGPVVFGGANTFGPELSLAHTLEAARPGRYAYCKFALDSTSLVSQWNPAHVYPVSGYRVVPDFLAFIAAAAAGAGAKPAWLVWIQGENDAQNNGAATAYGTNLASFWAAIVAVYPWLSISVGQLNSAFSVGAFGATVQAGEQSFCSGTANAHLVNQDAGTLDGGGQHYTADGYITIGNLHAATIQSALS